MNLPMDLVVAVAALLVVLLQALLFSALWRLGGQIQRGEARLDEHDVQLRQAMGSFSEMLRLEIAAATREAAETGHQRLQEATAAAQALRETLGERFLAFATEFAHQQDRLRERVDTGLGEIRTVADTRLEQVRATVDEQLSSALEKRVGDSFQRVAEQFAQVQQAIGQVQGVAGEIGSLRRLFSNVKARGGWGEAQLQSLLDDVLPPGAYEANRRLGVGEVVEFALRLPVRDSNESVWLPIDSKFPTEDYERLLDAVEAGDRDAETVARKGLERAIREQARRIARYVHPPETADHAVMYLPSEGLYGEVARIPGLLDVLRREFAIYVMGPALLPALLQMVRLGQLSLALERKAGSIGHTLAAVKTEWGKLGGALEKLAHKAEEMSGTIEKTRVRTRAVERALRGVDSIEVEEAAQLLGIEEETEVEPEPAVESRDGVEPGTAPD